MRHRPVQHGGRHGRAHDRLLLATGALAALGARSLLTRALLFKLRRDANALNDGDWQPLLRGYAEDAVLKFNDGDHRWSGEYRGKAEIGRFLQSFVDAGLKGQVNELFFSGPPWRMTLLVRFDDHALDADGAQIYSNRTVLLARTRWGRIVRHEDYYEDTVRIAALDRLLAEREAVG